MSEETQKPSYISDLETVYGAPSQSGFGSAVFLEHVASAADLEKKALERYKYFVGKGWTSERESDWMSAWKKVYDRPSGAKADIVNELKSVTDIDARNSIPMILDNLSDPAAGKKALSAAYDDPSVSDLKVYNLGDGGAMSGVLVAGRRSNGEAALLVFLLD